jgi:hypothetical protein
MAAAASITVEAVSWLKRNFNSSSGAFGSAVAFVVVMVVIIDCPFVIGEGGEGGVGGRSK